ncbi:hypothetical protein LINPERPRIM_LOCUS33707 [Linum perenne]
MKTSRNSSQHYPQHQMETPIPTCTSTKDSGTMHSCYLDS